MAKKVASTKKTASKKTAAKKKPGSGRKTPNKVSIVEGVGLFVVRESTKKPLEAKKLAKPPTADRPERIHSRRFPPRVSEGEERGVHSTTPAAFARATLAPGEEIVVVLDTELTKPGSQQTASNVGEPST